MGIPKFTSYLKETFPNAIQTKPRKFQVLAIDANGILHIAFRHSKTLDGVITTFKNSLRKTIRRYSIRNGKIGVFFDGQACFAKAREQISRRIKKMYEADQSISSLHLTPNTPFMEHVESLIPEILKDYNYHFSPTSEPNEGELKLMDWLSSINNENKQSIGIISDDADAIVLAIARTPIIGMTIVRSNEYIVIDLLITELAKIVPKRFGIKRHPVRQDFTLLCMLLGNDYLPKMVSFNILLNCYITQQEQKKGFLIDKKNNINILAFSRFMKSIPDVPKTRYSNNASAQEILDSLSWCYSLYQGRVDNRYIPQCKPMQPRLFGNQIVKLKPRKLSDTDWLHNDVFMLMLLPSTGIHVVREDLKPYMCEGSPIFDIFAQRCDQCVSFKKQISEIARIRKNTNNEKYLNELSIRASKINDTYRSHNRLKHPEMILPFKRIECALDLTNI